MSEPERCPWAGPDPIYTAYHDNEWGQPVTDDYRLFEKICLEGFQSGLSWLTILKKRENFRRAFDGFDFEKVARYAEPEVDRLLGDAGIVRHRGKILAAINNAGRAIEMRAEFGSLAAYFWQYEPAPKDRPERLTWDVLVTMPETDASRAMSKDLKKRGWRFVGPTTCYAFMQAMGLVNDHIETCHCRAPLLEKRAAFTPPQKI